MSQNNELQAAAQAVLDRWNSPKWEWDKHGPTGDLMQALHAALAEQAGRSVVRGWLHNTGVFESYWGSHMGDDWKPLYTHPAPVRQPLTHEQIDAAYRLVWSTVPHAQRLSAFARAIEAKINVPKQEDEVTTP